MKKNDRSAIRENIACELIANGEPEPVGPPPWRLIWKCLLTGRPFDAIARCSIRATKLAIAKKIAERRVTEEEAHGFL